MLVVTSNDSLKPNSLVTIWHKDGRGIEHQLGIGFVTRIQENKLGQVSILDIDNQYKEKSIEISNNTAFIQTLSINNELSFGYFKRIEKQGFENIIKGNTDEI